MYSALSGDVPLVGRSDLLSTIEDTLRRGEVYGVFVYGDTGMGKSVLARHLLMHLQGDFVPFLMTPVPGLDNVPYGALAPFLAGATARDMASPLSVLRRVMTFLRARAAGRPILLLVDDAHLLDDDSSHLLAQLVTSRTVGLAAFARPVVPSSDELFSLGRDGLLERFDVGPLGYGEAKELCTQVLGAGIVQGASDRLRDEASGNPLFLKAILDETLISGSLTKPDGVWTLADGELVTPAALVDLVRAMVLGLNDLERRAFDVVALAEVVPFVDLVRVSSEDAVSSLLVGDSIRSVPTDPSSAASSYPLYGRVARRLIPVGRSAALHRELRPATSPTALPPRAAIRDALWSLDCGEPVTDDRLLDLARSALELLDPHAALRLATAARSAHSIPGSRVLQATAQFELARLDESRRLSDGLLDAAGTPDLVAAAGTLEVRQALAGGDVTRTDDIMVRWSAALDRLPPAAPSGTPTPAGDPSHPSSTGERYAELLHDSLEHRTVTQALGWNLSGRYRETVDSLQSFVTTGSSSRRVLVLAHAILAEALGALGRSTEGRRHSATALTLAGSPVQPMPDLHRLAFLRHISLLVHSGELRSAEQALAQYEPGEGRDYCFVSGSLALLDAAIDVRRGFFRRGLSKLRPALVSLRTSDPDALLPYALGVTAWTAAALGQTEITARCSAELATTHQRGGRQYALLGRAFDAAAHALLRRDATGTELTEFAAVARSRGWASCEKDILELSTVLGNEDSAVLLAQVTRTLDGTEAAVLAAYASALSSRDASALAAAGDRAQVIQKYLLATEACRRAMEAFAEAGDARSQRALAAVARRRRGLIDGGLLVEPLESGGASPLTAREREIALLAVQGLSNRAIARSLTVSTRTVEGHLYRIYVKLGISRRDELTAELGPLLDAAQPGESR